MKKYLFLYWNAAHEGPPPSPEDMQQIMARWGAWKAKFKDQVVDAGDGLRGGGKCLKGGQVANRTIASPHAQSGNCLG